MRNVKCQVKFISNIINQTFHLSNRYLSFSKINLSNMEGIQAGKKAAAIEAVNNHISVRLRIFYFHFTDVGNFRKL